MLIKRGDRGLEVRALQFQLGIKNDGIFGASTEAAVVAFQTKKNITQDGKVGPQTWRHLTPFLKDSKLRSVNPRPSDPIKVGSRSNRWRKLTSTAYNEFGNLLDKLAENTILPTEGTGISRTTALAIIAVESGGNAFEDGRPIIRFENHVFRRQLRVNKTFWKYFTHDSKKPWLGHRWRQSENSPWTTQHTGGQAGEWESFEFARKINQRAAIQSISIGAPQMMGFNHRLLGYDTPLQMLNDYSSSATVQILSMFDFIRHNPLLLGAAQWKDWRQLARVYNGSGQVDLYSKWLDTAYQEARRLQ